MKAVIQRVKYASCEVDGNITGKIEDGFMILLGVYENDSSEDVKKLADKTAKLRVFCDSEGKMNKSLLDYKDTEKPYSVLVISQFTLCANTRHGNRPDFFSAAKPEIAKPLYEKFSEILENDYGLHTEHGIFGADMKISLLNDGPVTIILDSEELKK